MLQSINPEENIRLAPTEPAAATPTPAAQETPATQASPSAAPASGSGAQAATTTPPAAASTEGVAATTPAAASATASATPSGPSWLEPFRAAGLSEADEGRARDALIQSYRDAERLRPLAPAVSAYQQHAQQFHQWLNEQSQKPQVPQTQADWTETAGWKPPAGDFEALRRQVTTDAAGNVVPVPGAAPDVVARYQAANAYRQEFIEKFLTNPGKAIEPYVKHVAEQIASKYAEQNVGQYREKQEAQQFIEKHSDWLFERSQDGKPRTEKVLNPQTGQYETNKVLGQYGKLFVQHLQAGAQRGLSTDLQQEYALMAVQNAYMSSPEYGTWLSQSQTPAAPAAAAAADAGTPRQQANDKFTQRANPAAPPAPTGGGNATPAPQKVTRENLAQVMLQRLQDAGVSTT